MRQTICKRGHSNRSGANFCDSCGLPLKASATETNHHTESGNSDLTITQDQFADSDRPVRNIVDYGNNHRMMAMSTHDYQGQVLEPSDVLALVTEKFPDFNPTSCLPNDHAEGNKSSCKCSGTSDRLFDRQGRGRYLVRNRETSSLENAELRNPRLVEFLHPTGVRERVMFAEWLLSEALIEIGNRLPRGTRLTIVAGSVLRPGRYPAIGVVLRGTGETWALGVDRNSDFFLGDEAMKPPYVGWRGGSTSKGSGLEGRLVHQALKKIFSEPEWLAPHMWWSTHRELPTDRDGALMGESEYKEFVVTTFVESYQRLLEAVRTNSIVTPTSLDSKYSPASPSMVSSRELLPLGSSGLDDAARSSVAPSGHYGLEDLEAGMAVWGRKAISSEWPRDFHNEMYVTQDMRLSPQPFTQRWWSQFIMPRVGTWRAYRPATKADIEMWASTELEDMALAYQRCVVPYLKTPFEEIQWELVKEFTEVVARAKRNSAGGVQVSPVFRSKVCHWIAPRLFPVADQEVLGISDPYEQYWKQVQREWVAIPLALRTQLIKRLTDEIRRTSRYDLADNYPFEVKVIELCRIGRGSRGK